MQLSPLSCLWPSALFLRSIVGDNRRKSKSLLPCDLAITVFKRDHWATKRLACCHWPLLRKFPSKTSQRQCLHIHEWSALRDGTHVAIQPCLCVSWRVLKLALEWLDFGVNRWLWWNCSKMVLIITCVSLPVSDNCWKGMWCKVVHDEGLGFMQWGWWEREEKVQSE